VSSLICIDANFGLKLVLPEHDSSKARQLWDEWLERQITLIAPTLWLYEVTSVIRNRTHRSKIAPDLEEETIEFLYSLPIQFTEPVGLHRRAWQLAHQFNRPAAYDAHYLALAEMSQCPFWTADERLYNAVRHELHWVQWLGNYIQNGNHEDETQSLQTNPR
jgi:predicted nucleic acid-binding protein